MDKKKKLDKEKLKESKKAKKKALNESKIVRK